MSLQGLGLRLSWLERKGITSQMRILFDYFFFQCEHFPEFSLGQLSRHPSLLHAHRCAHTRSHVHRCVHKHDPMCTGIHMHNPTCTHTHDPMCTGVCTHTIPRGPVPPLTPPDCPASWPGLETVERALFLHLTAAHTPGPPPLFLPGPPFLKAAAARPPGICSMSPP